MIEPFADRAWAEAHEKISADVAAALARLARWVRRAALYGSDKSKTGELEK
jgi:ABC-type nitrate/sulfonate/bicarbonate transport system substrate-binding protein